MESESTIFDNRKAGKSTPIIARRSRSAATSWCGLHTSLLKSSITVERKGGLFNRLSIVETKACKRNLGGSSGVTQPSPRPMPGTR